MKLDEENTIEILPPNPIRVETALSRYPVHRLAKRGNIAIDIREKNEGGETSIKWEVTHSPGPLAYKIDTLVINRRIEEVARPIPKIIKLGSLRDICRELGQTEGENVNSIRNALRQNAFAGITARIRYKQNNGTERTLKADFTRYSVVFTGEELPDGRQADAVYIIFNDIYMQVINGAMTRPLDYDYLKILPPAAQRFYELLSYQMYAAIKNERPRAKLVYSELCKYAPLTRQTNWDIVRPQLARIHAPHRKYGYVGKIDFQDTTDSDGKPDWIILYQPGQRARSEFRAFTKRGGPVMLEVEHMSGPLPRLAETEPTPLQAALIGHGITPAVAGELMLEYGEEKVALQVEHLEWMIEKKPGKVTEPGAWLRTAITKGISLPKGFVSKVERQRVKEATEASERNAAEERRRQREQEAIERAEKNAIEAYWKSLDSEAQAKLDEAAQASADSEKQAIYTGPLKKLGQSLFREAYIRKLLQEQGKLIF